MSVQEEQDTRIKVVAEVVGNQIHLKTPFSEKERCQSIPGARWGGRSRPPVKAYILPATTSAVLSIKKAFPSESYRRIGNKEFAELATRAREAEAAQAHKTRDSLPDFPGPTEGWLHQRQAYWFAEALDAAMLAMDMGTGKSKVVVGLAEGWSCNVVLILCPAKAVDVWPTQFNGPLEVPDPKVVPCPVCDGEGVSEPGAGMSDPCPICEGKGEWLDETRVKELPYGHGVRKWEVLALDKTQGTVKKRTQLAEEAYRRASDAHPVAIVMNYEAAILEPFKKWAMGKRWDLVDLDESHKIKAPGGVTSRFCTSLGKRAQKRLCNTGTPMPHSPLDVYAQYRFLDAAIFGTSHHRFKQKFAVMGGFENKEVKGLQNEDELSRLFATLAYMCDAEDVLDLPPAMPPERRVCTLGRDATRIYDELDQELIADVGAGIVTAQNALTRLLRLQQATSGHTKTDEDERIVVLGEEKKKLLWDVLADLSPKEPVVVFTRFKHDIRVVREVCAEQERRVGEVSGSANDLVNAKFPKDKDLLAVQMQSGGTGVDLTRSCYAIYYSVGFSLGDYLQSLKRIHRPGQTRASHFYHLVAEKEGEKAKDRVTVDQVVYEALKAREDVVRRVLSAAKERSAVPA